jgi:putative transcriptional regulator
MPTQRSLFFPRLAPAILLLLLASICRADDDIILLVATPQLEGSLFEQSVILVAPHDNGAAMGVILNQPMPVDSADIYPGDELLRQAGVIHFGGPVEPGLLLFIFRSAEKPDGALHLFDDVYFSTSRELLENQMRRPRDESGLQLYMGYAGWSIGQLQAEIMRGSWNTVKATSGHVFGSDRTTLWQVLSGNARDKWI